MNGVSWAEFVASDMALAEAGARLLVGVDGIALAWLATQGERGPHLGPCCPIFSRGRVFLIASTGTPELMNLRADGRYALHAQLGEEHEAFWFSGPASEMADAELCAAVHADVPEPARDVAAPIFELRVGCVLHVRWRAFGTPEAERVARRWPHA